MDEKAKNHDSHNHKKPPEEHNGVKAQTFSPEECQRLKDEAAKAQEYWQRLLRVQADFENMRKRLEKEKQEFVKFANEAIIVELLTVLDDLERVVVSAQAGSQDLASFLKGVEMILAHLYEMLKRYGVHPIEAEGRLFDPHAHEALMQVEHNELPEHTVIEELQKGYMLNDRVIRTAKVKVSKKNAGAPGPLPEVKG